MNSACGYCPVGAECMPSGSCGYPVSGKKRSVVNHNEGEKDQSVIRDFSLLNSFNVPFIFNPVRSIAIQIERLVSI